MTSLFLLSFFFLTEEKDHNWEQTHLVFTISHRNKWNIHLSYMTQHFPTKCNLPPGLHPNNFFMSGYLYTLFWTSKYFTHVHPTPLKVHWKLSCKSFSKVLKLGNSAVCRATLNDRVWTLTTIYIFRCFILNQTM